MYCKCFWATLSNRTCQNPDVQEGSSTGFRNIRGKRQRETSIDSPLKTLWPFLHPPFSLHMRFAGKYFQNKIITLVKTHDFHAIISGRPSEASILTENYRHVSSGKNTFLTHISPKQHILLTKKACSCSYRQTYSHRAASTHDVRGDRPCLTEKAT
jgi:hypothetical protein